MSFLLNNFLFSYYPYVAIIIFLLGSIYRYENNQYSWKTSSSQLLENSMLFWANNLFHIGIIFLLFGHFFGLMTPKSIYTKIISPEKKQILAMLTGGMAGIICLIGLTLLLYRRILNIRINITSEKMDVLILIILYIQLIIGIASIFISYKHMENPGTMIALANWVQGIFILSPDIHLYVINEHWLFKIHLILGLTIFLIFPFTRLIHVFSFPYLYILREGYQIIRKY